MEKKPIFLFFIIMSMLLATGSIMQAHQEFDAETLKVMPFLNDPAACKECHNSEQEAEKLSDLHMSCDSHCYSCHKIKDSHHRVGLAIKTKVPDFVKLRNRKLACISCHDLTSNRFSDRPWKSKSLFGRLFKSKSKYHTYFLTVNNIKGTLCKGCH